MKVSIIAAIGKNRELGKNNKLLWHIKEDLQRFKNLTAGHPIIMGRKTWESLPFKPLPNRYTIIVTQNSKLKTQIESSKLKTENIFIANSIEQAIEHAKKEKGSEEVFIIGGGQIYKQALEKNLIDKLYLTIVDAAFEADTFFPDYSEFNKVIFEETHDDGKYKYKFLELVK